MINVSDKEFNELVMALERCIATAVDADGRALIVGSRKHITAAHSKLRFAACMALMSFAGSHVKTKRTSMPAGIIVD